MDMLEKIEGGRDFWISCNMNVLDSHQFKSKTRMAELSDDEQDDEGVSLEFLEKFMKFFAN